MRRRHVLAALLLSAAPLSAAPALAADAIRIGAPNWFSGQVAAKVLAEIMETRFGYPVEVIDGGNPEIYAGMTRQDGATPFDIHADSWQPGHAGWTAEAVKDGEMALSSGAYDGRIGLCAPRYTAEALNIRTVADLKKPGMAEKLDIDGDGRGDMWVGAEGWMMTAAYEVKIRDYGLDGFDALIAAEGEFQKTLYDAFAARDHLVFACYQPMTWFAMEHIEFIAEPEYDPAKHDLTLPGEDPEWKARSRVTVGEQVSRVSVAWRTDLAQRFPRAAALLDDFALTQDDLVEFMFMADIKGVALDAVVRDWVAANEARIAAWSGEGA